MLVRLFTFIDLKMFMRGYFYSSVPFTLFTCNYFIYMYHNVDMWMIYVGNNVHM